MPKTLFSSKKRSMYYPKGAKRISRRRVYKYVRPTMWGGAGTNGDGDAEDSTSNASETIAPSAKDSKKEPGLLSGTFNALTTSFDEEVLGKDDTATTSSSAVSTEPTAPSSVTTTTSTTTVPEDKSDKTPSFSESLSNAFFGPKEDAKKSSPVAPSAPFASDYGSDRNLEDELNDAKLKISSLEEEITTLRSQLDTKDEKIEELHGTVQSTQAKLIDVQSEQLASMRGEGTNMQEEDESPEQEYQEDDYDSGDEYQSPEVDQGSPYSVSPMTETSYSGSPMSSASMPGTPYPSSSMPTSSMPSASMSGTPYPSSSASFSAPPMSSASMPISEASMPSSSASFSAPPMSSAPMQPDMDQSVFQNDTAPYAPPQQQMNRSMSGGRMHKRRTIRRPRRRQYVYYG